MPSFAMTRSNPVAEDEPHGRHDDDDEQPVFPVRRVVDVRDPAGEPRRERARVGDVDQLLGGPGRGPPRLEPERQDREPGQDRNARRPAPTPSGRRIVIRFISLPPLSRPPGRTAGARALGGDRDGRAKNLDRDGFLQEIGGASLHPFDAGRDGAVSGENDDLNVGMELPDLPQGGQTVHARHLQVEDDDVGGQLFEKRQSRPRRERGRRVEAAPGEALGDGGGEVLLVVHDEHPDRVRNRSYALRASHASEKSHHRSACVRTRSKP